MPRKPQKKARNITKDIRDAEKAGKTKAVKESLKKQATARNKQVKRQSKK